ncbi:MAG: hydroxylamine oxidoreductase, partial [Gammaproteobacteria bacterium]|nr:hydroxylamine oxidoreductase [Gammaproteobacteria bacterium]
GRRARHGAAMFAPDYAHWEGMFVMAKRFYIEIVPSIKKRIKEARAEGNIKGADAVEKLLNETLESPLHRWFLGKEPPKFWRPTDDDNHGFMKAKQASK